MPKPRPRPARLDPRFARDDITGLVNDWKAECGDRVSKRRQVFNLHRRELADLAGTTEATIIRVEAGRQNASDALRLAIAGVLRCEVADLWPYPPCERIHSNAEKVA